MRRLIFITVAFLSLVFGFTCSEAGIPQDCRNLLLQEKWQAVFETLKKDDSLTADPVARLLMGHACLANNRNNESILLFLSAKEEEDLNLWSKWTESLLRRHSKNPVALYLSADAKARIGRLDEANEAFTQALRIRNNFALALNARGVVRVLNNEWDVALIDFYQATTLAPELADAHANLGTYWVINEVSGTGALDAFNHAIAINPNFALAYNGRGSLYFGSGEFEKADQDFNMAFQLSPALLVAEVNQGLTSAYASQLITLASLTKKKPGTTLNSLIQQYPNVLNEQKQDLLKMLPTQKDQAFWKKMDTFPTLSQNQISSLVKEYGLQKVHIGASLKMQELQGQIAEDHQRGIPFSKKLDFSDRVSSIAFSSLNLDKGIGANWKPFLTPMSNYQSKEKVISNMLRVPSASSKNLAIYVSDFGINQWKPELKMFDDFSHAKASVVPNLPKQSQILVPMPPDQHFPKSPAEHQQLTLKIFEGLKQRIGEGKLETYEIQIVQNINTAGYFAPWRQNMVKEFGRDVYNAVSMLKDGLSSKGVNVDMPAVVGSNGAFLLTETLPKLKNNPIDRAVLVDGRAYVTPTKETYKILQGNLIGINTAGDALALPGMPAVPNLIANHDVMKSLKKELPDMKVFWVDAKGSDLWLSTKGLFPQHTASMRNPQLLAKEWDGKGYTTPTKMKGWDLISKSVEVQPPSSAFSLYKGGPIETAMNAAHLRVMEKKLNSLAGISTSFPPKQSPPQIRGYYTSTSRPLAELGALASMVDKGIKPVESSARSALIVSQDRFRANLLQSELSKHGFQTKVVPPGINPQTEAKRLGADVILGIKDPSKKFYDDIERKIPPPFPPGGPGSGGTAISAPQMVQPQVKQNWDWGKSYIPTYPRGGPGGISTEELARSFVDKGNWPVMTSFGLFYEATTLGSESEKGK